LAALLIGPLSCGGPTFDGAIYRTKDFAFRVPAPPPSWVQLDVSDAALAFRDDEHGATVAVNGRCGIDGEDVPLASLTQHLFLQFTERQIVAQEVVPFDQREAMHSTIVAKLDGVPMKFDVWVMKKDGCVYDLYYFARADGFDAGVDEFRRFVSGFATVPVDDDR
jgi:hypothetical protein